MATRFGEIFTNLCAPFAPHEVKTRPGSGNRQLHYVTATTVANRLDQVLGPECWDFELVPWTNDALIGTIVIRLPDGSIIRKSNVGGKADMQAADDDAKSAASDCLKRCAALLGVGRYLYRDGMPDFAGDGQVTQAPAPSASSAEPRPAQSQYQGPPRSGRGLFAWTKEQEQKHGVGLLKYLNNWARLQELPGRMVDWTDEQVASAYTEACRKLQSVAPDATSSPTQPPAAQPPRVNGASPGDDPLRLRMRLIHLIWEASRARYSTDKNIPENYWVIKSEIDNDPEMNGEIISDVNTCEDIPLLKRAIAVAERLAKEAATPF